MPTEAQLLAEGNIDVKDISELAGSKGIESLGMRTNDTEYKQLVELLHMRQQQEREKRIKPTDESQAWVHLGFKVCILHHQFLIKFSVTVVEQSQLGESVGSAQTVLTTDQLTYVMNVTRRDGLTLITLTTTRWSR